MVHVSFYFVVICIYSYCILQKAKTYIFNMKIAVNKRKLTLNTVLAVTLITHGEFTPSSFLRRPSLFGKIQIRRFDNEFVKLK